MTMEQAYYYSLGEPLKWIVLALYASNREPGGMNQPQNSQPQQRNPYEWA